MRKRGNVVFSAAVAAVLLVVGLAYLLILEPCQPRPTAPPDGEPVADASRTARVSKAMGAVEIRIATGQWQTAAAGTEVGPDTDVRTGEEGSATVAYGEALDIELSSDSQMRLQALEADRARFEILSGRVVADVRPESGRSVEIAAAGSDAVAETRDGRLHVLTDGEGMVQAAVTRGSANVTAQGKTVALPAGYQTSIQPGQAPQTPMALPPSLLLKVKWPPGARTSKKRQLVLGNTAPGARVKIGQTIVTADDHGRFRAVVELKEGKNRLSVRALDVVGRIERARSPPVELDTRAPSQAFETNPNMWKQNSP